MLQLPSKTSSRPLIAQDECGATATLISTIFPGLTKALLLKDNRLLPLENSADSDDEVESSRCDPITTPSSSSSSESCTEAVVVVDVEDGFVMMVAVLAARGVLVFDEDKLVDLAP